MSVKGRVYPFRVAYKYDSQDKPGTNPYLTRWEAESAAEDIQGRGGRAEVLLVLEDKTRVVITEFPQLPRLPDDCDDESVRLRSLRIVNGGGSFVVTNVTRGDIPSQQLARVARDAQRAGHQRVEILNQDVVTTVLPALSRRVATHPHLVFRAFDERHVRPVELHYAEQRADRTFVYHTAECVGLGLVPLCGLEPTVRDHDGSVLGSCIQALLVAEVDAAREADARRVTEATTRGPVRPAPMSDARPVYRCPDCGGRITEMIPGGEPEVQCPSCPWTGDAEELAITPAPAAPDVVPPPSERRAGYARDMGKAAEDAETALGGELGRMLGVLLRTAGKHAERGELSGVMGVRFRRVAELVTERAIAVRDTPRGGPERGDLHRAALDAYSDRFEQSRHEVRDHQAAMQDAIDTVFDTIGRGQHQVVLNPVHGTPQVAVRVGDVEPAWRVSNGGHYTSKQVAGWREMVSTGRRFDPETSARPSGRAEHQERETRK